MGGKIFGLFMVTAICASALLVPLMSTDADASDSNGPIEDIATDYQRYFIERLSDSVSPGITEVSLTRC